MTEFSTAVTTLDYKRNRVAQRLRARRSLLIGILVSDIANPFLSTIVATVEAAFFARGYSVLMSNTGGNPPKEMEYLTMMENEEAAGLVIVPTVEDVSRVTELAAAGMPIVVVDRLMPHARVDCVLSDNIGGARSAVEHLIQLGHKQIGHVGGPLHLSSGRERLQGYLDAMQCAGLPVNPDCDSPRRSPIRGRLPKHARPAGCAPGANRPVLRKQHALARCADRAPRPQHSGAQTRWQSSASTIPLGRRC